MKIYLWSTLVLLLALLLGVSATVDAQNVGGNATTGKTLFEQRCALCHVTSGQATAGPSLAGIVGNKSAASNFNFTKELRAANLTWDAATLDRFIANPSQVVPGTAMAINIPDATERRDVVAFLATLPKSAATAASSSATTPLVADDGDWPNAKPGKKYRFSAASLPAPFATASARNFPPTAPRPDNAEISVPAGFTVAPFAKLTGPRVVRVAPNGDIFVAETRSGRVTVIRAADGASEPAETAVFAEGLTQPFGIAFYPTNKPEWVYVANINSVVRFPYRVGDLKARGPAETIVEKLSDTTGGHSTRDIAFSKDDKRMFVSVGSGSNVAETMGTKTPEEVKQWEATRPVGAAWGNETNRADVLVFTPDGKNEKIFATGIRNCVGVTIHPTTGALWCVTNERDLLGDNLVPDYGTSVKENAFYGWPWYYIGNNPDPRFRDNATRPDLPGKITVPDVLFQAHSAALGIAFYNATKGAAAFPKEYQGDAFVAFHGSWNRGKRTGYKVVRMKMNQGVATGEYEDFLTGFVIDDSKVWGRPVGVAVARDGALLVTDDASNTLWRIAYQAH
jgi:glucose/arabinose dehydrogenase